MYSQTSTVELAKRRSAALPPAAAHPRSHLRPVVLMDGDGHAFAYALRESTADYLCSEDGTTLLAKDDAQLVQAPHVEAAVAAKPALDDDAYAQALRRMKAFMSNMLEPRKELGVRDLSRL